MEQKLLLVVYYIGHILFYCLRNIPYLNPVLPNVLMLELQLFSLD